MEPDALSRYLPRQMIRRRVRKTAVRRVRKDLILHGKVETDMSTEDLEYLLADAEKDIIAELKQTSLLGALALLGLSIF